ncbi:MAG: DUF4145 domain-containing protein [Thermoleophilaceae bacterium]
MSLSKRPTHIDHGGGDLEETTDQTVLLIQHCTVCDEPTLSSYRYVDGWSDPMDFMGLKRIHPPMRNMADLPSRIRDRYGRMLELLHAPDAFAVRAGRLLEAVCMDQGVPDGDLGPRLDQLAGRKGGRILPRALADQAHLIREFRNLGGHDGDVEVEARDVPLIRDFAEGLLEFLYWGPAKLERGRQALQQRIGEAGGSP